jgi:hypothetical protein
MLKTAIATVASHLINLTEKAVEKTTEIITVAAISHLIL